MQNTAAIDKDLKKILPKRFYPHVDTIPAYDRLLVGPKPLIELVKAATKDAIQLGYKLAKKETERRSKERARKYLAHVTEIAKAIHRNVEKFAPDVNIKEIRTNLDLFTQQIDLLVLIDYSDPKDWLKFSRFISGLERVILEKWSLVAEIFYVKADSRIDYEAINTDYPFVYCPTS